MAVGATNHRDLMFAFQPLGFIHHIGPAKQPLCFPILRQMIEEGSDMFIEMIENCIPDRVDVGSVIR